MILYPRFTLIAASPICRLLSIRLEILLWSRCPAR
nr:MAG TPA: hypothetical protein [Bacteriophage sp.]